MDVESLIRQIFKKILLLVLGSGILSDALHIYGLSYYRGLVESLGFEVLFFPVDWEEARLWTYSASRELGVSTVNFWIKLTFPHVLLIMLVAYIVARVWMAINQREKRAKKPDLVNRKPSKFVAAFKERYPFLFRVLRVILITEQSIWALVASYFVLVFIFFVPLFIFVWVYFPIVGASHGEEIGARYVKIFEKDLCDEKESVWNACVSLVASNGGDEKMLPIFGRVLLKHENVVGVFTKEGPVTMTVPESFYYKAQRNATPVSKAAGKTN